MQTFQKNAAISSQGTTKEIHYLTVIRTVFVIDFITHVEKVGMTFPAATTGVPHKTKMPFHSL